MHGTPLRASAAAALVVLLAGCSSTPLGQQLGESFGPQAPAAAKSEPEPPAEPSGQQDPPASADEAAPAAVVEPPANDAAQALAAAEPSQEPEAAPTPAAAAAPEPEPEAEAATGSSRAPDPVPPRDPLPYRVVLKLPAADPSAPAEAVTKALRAAGLPFEVETIERVQEPASDER